MKWLKRLGWLLLIVALSVPPAYYVLVMRSPQSDGREFVLDIEELRRLADSLPGPKATEIRYEHVATFQFTEAMVVAGDPWRKTLLPVYSYQLLFPDHTLIVDTALDRSLAQPEGMVPMFDEAAWRRMSDAMLGASQIVVTHEHADHIGGIANHPRLSAILPAVRLNAEQMNKRPLDAAELPKDLFRNYVPLQYERVLPIEPGVVLVRAPGHTPGSQMVYVKLADGRELLLLGDVAWHMRSIELNRERPLFMTAMIGEDRQAVLAQFAALRALSAAEPQVHLVPGHDSAIMQGLVEAGLVAPRFVEVPARKPGVESSAPSPAPPKLEGS